VQFPDSANIQLVDLLKKMFIKDPDRRISLQEIINHDWITCNGVQPLEIQSYMPVVLDLHDYALAIGKVATIELIKIRMKKHANRIRLKKNINLFAAGLQAVEESDPDAAAVVGNTMQNNFSLGPAGDFGSSVQDNFGGLGGKPALDNGGGQSLSTQ
jgi:serine/threonine protein kinase